MAIPTWEEYQRQKHGATWMEYVEKFSAMAAQRQYEAGEIPAKYTDYSFTPAGVWVKSGTPASIIGLPSEITDIFPGVEKEYQGAYEKVTGESVITTSRASEAQTSFQEQPSVDRSISEHVGTIGTTGGTSPIEFYQPGRRPSQSFGVRSIGGLTNFGQDMPSVGSDSGIGAVGLLALLAMMA